MQDDELQDFGKATKFEVLLINYRKIVEEEMTQTFYAHMNKRTLKKKKRNKQTKNSRGKITGLQEKQFLHLNSFM
jgi:hypothetical protein